ncbi:hypothetical protein Bca52824_003399 [Brassica carinata]|uniref:Uncharacterized protein n=1 Tax=Brassica carinata TaxID=52824 RepID=A0A8X7WJR9_BRACI|nr:hypothetical protein Bca52824_003399 [Brassica carinata]
MYSDSVKLPEFSYFIYHLLVDLHNIFNGIPTYSLLIKRLFFLKYSFSGLPKIKILLPFPVFRIAVEGIRIALNKSGRLPIWNLGYLSNQTQVQFSKLSSTEKSYKLMADNLHDQAKKFKNIAAVVDAGNLAGLRRHWRTCDPQEVKDMSTEHTLLKPLAPLKLSLTNTQEETSLAKTIFIRQDNQGSNSVYIIFCSRNQLLFRTIYTLILYTIIIWRRRAKSIGTLPVAMFGVSLATYAGLGIICAAETLTSAPSIAKLGHGVQNLPEASQEMTGRENKWIPKVMRVLVRGFQNPSFSTVRSERDGGQSDGGSDREDAARRSEGGGGDDADPASHGDKDDSASAEELGAER